MSYCRARTEGKEEEKGRSRAKRKRWEVGKEETTECQEGEKEGATRQRKRTVKGERKGNGTKRKKRRYKEKTETNREGGQNEQKGGSMYNLLHDRSHKSMNLPGMSAPPTDSEALLRIRGGVRAAQLAGKNESGSLSWRRRGTGSGLVERRHRIAP